MITARQAITDNWWQDHKSKYEIFVSGLVIQEISKGDEEAAHKRLKAIEGVPMLGISEEALSLAADLLAQGAVP